MFRRTAHGGTGRGGRVAAEPTRAGWRGLAAGAGGQHDARVMACKITKFARSGHESPGLSECLASGCGSVGAIICLDPACHEQHVGERIAAAEEALVQRDGHWWKLCYCCNRAVLSDPGSWGTHALCVLGWNRFAAKGELPPPTPRAAYGGTPA